ncbi:MAG: ABC transporter ATP-binding protein [Candidatus Kariarchaeaceae archaeon]|jgi:peptide/nickel transport system ATP-binding protein
MSEEEIILEVEGLTSSYRGTFGVVTAVEDFTLKIYKGDVVAIAGESGSGKSTFAEIITGTPKPMLHHDAGRVSVEGYDIYTGKGPAGPGSYAQTPRGLVRMTEILVIFYLLYLVTFNRPLFFIFTGIGLIGFLVRYWYVKRENEKNEGKEDLSVRIDPEILRNEVKTKIMSYVPQASLDSLNPVLKLIDFIENVVEERTGGTFDGVIPGVTATAGNLSRNERKQGLIKFAGDHFERVGLDREVLFKYPHELSGGMKQRAVIAISTMWNPKLLIVDEPTSALDVSSQKKIVKMLYEMKQAGIIETILFVSHDVSTLSQICNKMLIMYSGQIQEYGDMEDIVKEPLHPYSKLLMDSIVSFDPSGKNKKRLESIDGAPPNLKDPPKGCRFYDRCPEAMDHCKTQEPPVYNLIEKDRLVKCWLYEEEAKL